MEHCLGVDGKGLFAPVIFKVIIQVLCLFTGLLLCPTLCFVCVRLESKRHESRDESVLFYSSTGLALKVFQRVFH